MKTTKKTLQILIALFFTGILTAQTVTGKVADNLDVIPFANVILKDNQQKIITGATTKNDGTFELKTNQGNYILEISFLGYKTFSKTINIKGNLNLGTLILRENTEALDEIVVKTEKKDFRKKNRQIGF